MVVIIISPDALLSHYAIEKGMMLNYVKINVLPTKLYSSYHHLHIFSTAASLLDCFIPANIANFPSFFDLPIPLEFQHQLLLSLTSSVSKMLLIFVSVFSFLFILFQSSSTLQPSATLTHCRASGHFTPFCSLTPSQHPICCLGPCCLLSSFSLKHFRSFPINSQIRHFSPSMSWVHLTLIILFLIILLQGLHSSTTLDEQPLDKTPEFSSVWVLALIFLLPGHLTRTMIEVLFLKVLLKWPLSYNASFLSSAHLTNWIKVCFPLKLRSPFGFTRTPEPVGLAL